VDANKFIHNIRPLANTTKMIGIMVRCMKPSRVDVARSRPVAGQLQVISRHIPALLSKMPMLAKLMCANAPY